MKYPGSCHANCARYSSQQAESACISTASVVSAGCRPSRINSTRSGASGSAALRYAKGSARGFSLDHRPERNRHQRTWKVPVFASERSGIVASRSVLSSQYCAGQAHRRHRSSVS